MSKCAEVVIIVEGQTEQRFVKELLAPYLAPQGVYLTPIILNKPGEKGGDVKFSRAQNDIGKHLKQRYDTWVTLLVDYYGIKADWPGFKKSKAQTEHHNKARIMNQATADAIQCMFPDCNQGRRFIPYVSMHEIEALYFSDPTRLAEKLQVEPCRVEAILKECEEPEKINDHNTTAPSKRLKALSDRFKKTSTGIAIAREIGVARMRAKCPLFDNWLMTLESLAKRDDGEQ